MGFYFPVCHCVAAWPRSTKRVKGRASPHDIGARSSKLKVPKLVEMTQQCIRKLRAAMHRHLRRRTRSQRDLSYILLYPTRVPDCESFFLRARPRSEFAGRAQHDAVQRGGAIPVGRCRRAFRPSSIIHGASEHDDYRSERASGVPKSMKGKPSGESRRYPGEALVAQVASTTRE